MSKNSEDRDDRLVLEGVVIDSNKGIFRVQVSPEHIVICKLSGKIKLHEVKVITGDEVEIHVSPYDTSIGRITRRHKRV